MTLFLNRKLFLPILLTIPLLMTIGGMRTPNLAKLLELRQHVHHCALFQAKHKIAGNHKLCNLQDSHDLEFCRPTVVLTPVVIYANFVVFAISFGSLPPAFASTRAPPTHRS